MINSKVLQQIDIFKNIALNHLEILAFSCNTEVYKAKTTIIKKGNIYDFAMIIMSGTIITSHDENNTNTYNQGDIIGTNHMILPQKSSYDIISKTDSKLLIISKKTMDKFILDFPYAGELMIDVIYEDTINLTKKIDDIITTKKALSL